MPYVKTEYDDGLVVESEHTRTTLRVFENKERIFSCEITTINPVSCRITNAFGTMKPSIWRSIQDWMRNQKYEMFFYERKDIDGSKEKHFYL